MNVDQGRRVFILGAGFSKPAGMPLATQLVAPLIAQLEMDEMREWLEILRTRLAWLAEDDGRSLNIEEVFHFAQFDIETHRLRQHTAAVGRLDGPGTPWRAGESIGGWLSQLEWELAAVIHAADEVSDIAPIDRWATDLRGTDTVLTFNYDTLVERALTANGAKWNLASRRRPGVGIAICKLHGSIDWIVADRPYRLRKTHDLVFDKVNFNRRRTVGPKARTEDVEEDFRLWRCRSRDQLRDWMNDRDFQIIPKDAHGPTVGIAGLGSYKQVHRIPGLGRIWAHGMRALLNADTAVVVGFAMSDFDTLAQLQFAEVARARIARGNPLRVTVVDPGATDPALQSRFRRVFRNVAFVSEKHENFDWSSLA